jgi:hypothetical protein
MLYKQIFKNMGPIFLSKHTLKNNRYSKWCGDEIFEYIKNRFMPVI